MFVACDYLSLYMLFLFTSIDNPYLFALFLIGILVRKRDKPDEVAHAPFVLLPTPVPRNCFHEACLVQKDVALLMHRIAGDYDFLKKTLQP